MADIQITIDPPVPPVPQISLQLRKSLDGDFMIFDHMDIDIVVMPEKKKVLALAKETYSDEVYSTQDRLFQHLSRKGVIKSDTVQGGNVYGSLQGAIIESADESVDSVQVVLYSIHGWLEGEKPYFESIRSHEEREVEELTEPSPEDSTDWNSDTAKAYLKTSSTFVRATESSDDSVPTIDSLAESLVSKITADWYKNVLVLKKKWAGVMTRVAAFIINKLL